MNVNCEQISLNAAAALFLLNFGYIFSEKSFSLDAALSEIYPADDE